MDIRDEVLVGQGQDFERICRITDYLAVTIDQRNNSERAEARNRLKHNI